MSRSPGGSGQRSIDDGDLVTRIEDCLDGVLSNALARCERISRRTALEKKSFFCRSDLENIWSSEPRPIDAVFGHLSEDQRKALLEHLLLFISFLVKVGVRSRFILSCQDVFFGDAESTTTKFKDADGPIRQEELLRMGLNPLQAHSWEVQYLFRPAKITIAAERWEPQQIEDPRVPLPFELIDHVHSGVTIHGGFGDDTGYESQYGKVRLCRIPEEYVGNAIGSETWRPEGPLLRIVKSFLARQNVIEEARNMELLKQSLQTAHNISIHDAIIEQMQEDDTEIVSIVSPYASLGDLAQFLAGGYGITRGRWGQIYDVDAQFPRAADAHQLKMSLLGQSKNLASALEFLHNGFTTSANDWKIICAHLDLKPSNILIFESNNRDDVVGNWKLCDFGISVFDAERLQGSPTVELGSAGDFFNRVENTIRTSPRRIPGSYQAPEIEHSDYRRNPDFGARTSDIWSFGTIFAEVLAYASGGASGVESFKEERRLQTPVNGKLLLNDFFYTTVPENMGETSMLPCVLRREVSQWLKTFISAHEPARHPPGVCLRCWAECVQRILEVNPRKRPSASTLYRWVADVRAHTNDASIAHLQFRGSGPLSPTLEWTERERESVSSPSEAPVVRVFEPEGRSHLVRLPLSSHDVIDYDLDGKRLAYLTKTTIELFLVDSQGPDHHEVERLQSGHGWCGIKVAEPYLVVWGSDLRVYKMSNGQLSRAQNSARNMNFNATRRVAVSRQGYIAVIHNAEILILDANDKSLKELSKIKMAWQYPVGKFLDVVFDSSGSTLYAWGNQDLYGVLFAYEFEESSHGVGEEIFRGKYMNTFSQNQGLILPFDNRRECAVAGGPTPTSFFLGNIIDQSRRSSSTTSRTNSSSTGSERFTRQNFSEHPNGYSAWAGCTVRDSMLLVGATKGGILAPRKVGISEQVIGSDGRLRSPSRSPEHPALENRRGWWPKHNQGLNTDVKVGVIPSDGAVDKHSVVVYSKRGVVEVLS